MQQGGELHENDDMYTHLILIQQNMVEKPQRSEEYQILWSSKFLNNYKARFLITYYEKVHYKLKLIIRVADFV